MLGCRVAGDPRRAPVSSAPLVVDTNVVVAGLLTREPTAATARILDSMLAGERRFLLSEALLREVRTVLLRPAIAKAHGLAPAVSIPQLCTGIFRDGFESGDTPRWSVSVPARGGAE